MRAALHLSRRLVCGPPVEAVPFSAPMRAPFFLALLLVASFPAALAQSISASASTGRIHAEPEIHSRSFDHRPSVEHRGGLTFYATRAAFDDANPGLPVEDFEDVEVAPGTWCASFSPVDSGSDDDCYDRGTLMAPLGIAAVGPTQSSFDAVIALGAGYFGQPSTVLGANLGADTTEIRFNPGVHAAGMDVRSYLSTAEITVTVFDTGGIPLGTTTITSTPAGLFFGVRADGAVIGAVRFAEHKDYVFLDNIAMGAYGGQVTFDPTPLVAALESGDTGAAFVAITNHTAQAATYNIALSTAPTFVIDVTPASGTLPAGGSVDVQVTFDATSLNAGIYAGSIVVETDLATNPDAFVLPVVLAVSGMAACAITTDPVVFDPTIVGGSSSEEATVTNTGTDSCMLISASADDPFAVAGFTASALAPGASTPITVVYTPTEAGNDEGTLTVGTDGSPLLASLLGSALDAPTPAVDPDALTFEVAVGEMDVQTFTLSNTGGANAAHLEYSIFVAGVQPTARADEGGTVTITHSASQEIISGYGVNCPTPPTSWWRVFDLSTFGIDTELRIGSVDIGVEAATAGTTIVNLYTLDGILTSKNLTLVATAMLDVGPDDALSVVSVPILATLAEDAVLAVEWQASHDGVLFGANPAGQTGPTYMQADACGAPEPFDIADAGFGLSHWVLNVNGETGPPLVSVAPQSGSVAPGESEEITVTVDAAGFAPGSYAFELRIGTNDPGVPTVTVPVSVEVQSGTANEDAGLPTVFALDQNRPNPFAGGTTIRYALPRAARVTLDVYDTLGRRVSVLVDEERPAGYHEAVWDARGLASGLYFYRIRAEDYLRTRPMAMVR